MFTDITLLSKYRTQIMGFAMLWIIYFHMSITPFTNLTGSIKGIGYGGVDIFLFVSGIGMLFSWTNNKDIKSFYKRRVLRIVPLYIFTILIFGIIGYINNKYPISTVIYSLTSLDVLTGKWSILTHWFIPFILYLYLITPWFLKFFEKNIGMATIVITLACIIFAYVQKLVGINSAFTMLLVSRIPIYFIGIYTGTLIKKGIKLKYTYIILFFMLMIVGFIMLFYLPTIVDRTFLAEVGLLSFPFTLIVFPLCIILVNLFNLFPNYKYPILTFAGTYSLTIYLLHDNILNILSDSNSMSNISNLSINILAIIITVPLSYYLQNKTNLIIDQLQRKQTKKLSD